MSDFIGNTDPWVTEAERLEVCGESYDHDVETTYEGPDGWQGECRRCGAELWEDQP